MAKRQQAKYVSMWQETDDPTEVTVDTDRPRLTEEEQTKVIVYLQGGSALMRTTARVPDPLRDDDLARVPISQHTDGEWIWDDAVLYFVAEYGLTPPDDFMAYLRARDFRPRKPTAAELQDYSTNSL